MKKITEKLLEIIRSCDGKYTKKVEDRQYCPLIPVTKENFEHKMCECQSVLINIIPKYGRGLIKYTCYYEKK